MPLIHYVKGFSQKLLIFLKFTSKFNFMLILNSTKLFHPQIINQKESSEEKKIATSCFCTCTNPSHESLTFSFQFETLKHVACTLMLLTASYKTDKYKYFEPYVCALSIYAFNINKNSILYVIAMSVEFEIHFFFCSSFSLCDGKL